ncbi:MAG TPA: hypothetical protein VEB22_12290, partial [Phycisphaerales bacterium]|nr:hypothetical protein [Phycisphaerales bacterium]
AQRMVEAEKITVTITREMRIRIDCDNAKEDKLAFCGERVPDGDPSFFDKSRLPPLPPRRPNAPNRRRDFCEAIDDMLELARRCMAARESVINNCFGGVADAGHREAKRRLTREIEELERLREENCP